jgi:hypothetical protein
MCRRFESCQPHPYFMRACRQQMCQTSRSEMSVSRCEALILYAQIALTYKRLKLLATWPEASRQQRQADEMGPMGLFLLHSEHSSQLLPMGVLRAMQCSQIPPDCCQRCMSQSALVLSYLYIDCRCYGAKRATATTNQQDRGFGSVGWNEVSIICISA